MFISSFFLLSVSGENLCILNDVCVFLVMRSDFSSGCFFLWLIEYYFLYDVLSVCVLMVWDDFGISFCNFCMRFRVLVLGC